MSKTKFKVVRGLEDVIKDLPIIDGYVYFAYDSGRMYMDVNGERVPVGGGNGVVIHYGQIPEDLEPESLNTYGVTLDMFENSKTVPQVGDLILNADGRFLRIKDFDGESYKCVVISVSGVGGGNGPSTSIGQAMSLIVTRKTPSSTILNGQSVPVDIKATSAKDTSGVEIDQEIYLSYTISVYENGQVGTQYEQGALPDLPSGDTLTYDFGPLLRPNTSSVIIISATSGSMETPKKQRTYITSSELRMEPAANFSNNNVFFANEEIILACNVIGNIDKILDFVYDGKVIHTEYLKPNSTQEQKFSIKPTEANAELLTHGAHTVEFQVYQDINPIKHERGNKKDVAPIVAEIAVVDKNNPKPVIWLGEYQDEYKTYDDIKIPYKIYNNGETKAKVHFYKNNQEIEGSPYDIEITNQFEIFEISDAQENATNYYAIGCGEQNLEVRRDFTFVVVEDKEHDMTNPQKASLKLNFDAKGRSNRESKVKRNKWVDPVCGVNATFENFNWNNNGWIMDKGQTCLRISNGAKFKIPFGPMTFSGGGNTNTSNSFDLQFKIRNIQNYANLIKTVTRYKNDDNWYANYVAEGQKEYASYDSYLGALLPAPNKEGEMTAYDDLEFVGTEKFISLESLVCGYYDGDSSGVRGFCIGPQDAFFSNGANTVSADFVEDQMVYLSFVYDGTKKNASGKITPMIYIYLNGVLTGVIRTDISESFTIGGEGKEIVFNSEVCDIDLYKLRFYNTALSVNDVVMNYAIDTKDITTYDQNGLAEYISSIQEYRLNYDKVLKYNVDHPRAPLMPYVIFDTTNANNNDRLSFSKAYKVKIDMEFHNVPLETAFRNGELEDLAIADGLLKKGETDAEKKAEAVRAYYKHHCPSFRAEASQLEVQGTSSQFYPRRNYKVKMKTDFDSDKVNRTHFWLMGGPYDALFTEHGTKRDIEEVKDKETGEITVAGYTNPCHTDWFYMDNYTVGTNRFTMKVDYMESSGTYNMGLANLAYNAYSKHPLEDYIKNNAFIMDGTKKTEDKDITDEVKAALGSSVKDADGNKLGLKWSDYRTSVKGYPVMAFHKKSDGSVQFIGLYRMLLDKGSDECYGMKPDKKVLHRLLGKKKTKVDETTGETIEYISYPKLRDVVECWEFSDNNRGFCSFRDPWNREEFSFKAPTVEEDPDATRYTGALAPIVADSFEYRYSQYEDALDVIYEIGGETGEFSPLPLTKNDKGEYEDERTAALKDAFGDDFNVTDLDAIHEGLFKAMRNYEKVCAWVWATNMENVMSGGTYSVIELGDTPYKANTFYIRDGEGYVMDPGTAFDPEKEYFRKVTTASGDDYEAVTIVDDAHTYKKKVFYTKSTLEEDAYVLAEGEFDSAETYYTFTTYSNEEIENIIATQPEKAKHTKKLTERYTEAKYPGYLTEDGYATWDLNKKYAYDTQEFRNEKFTNELAHHFDIEYLAAYFIITEVLEMYDSRGKNCMMASWGPKVAGGEYIWYPIFYDADTQLGINNTGIPSFSYNVDATEEGNYSTSDSVLWNNFYKAYKSSYILDKYKHLKGQEISAWGGTLNNAIFSEVAKVEAWYNADPNECKSIAMRGERPLVVKNLDEYYKYITITNNLGLHPTDKTSGILNTTGYQFGEQGLYDFDDAGTYFYALQGDRSLSRQQFLTNRFEYIDSWLNQGNYQRGGANRIRGRVSANYQNKESGEWYTSDHWLESTDGYWKDNKEFTTKVNDFDSQYWLTLQPVRNTYVTLGGDANTTYPSQKYSGVPINYKVNEMEAAVRNSNLAEKLLYVYGMNQMASAGDLYKNYWTEFYLEGELNKLNSLLLGCDGLMYNNDGTIRLDPKGELSIDIDEETGRITKAAGTHENKAYRWYNNKINLPTMPSGGLPLLEEANFSNLQIQVTDPTLNLSASEKLQVFRATGSNYTKIDFAPGAALHTLYLPKSVTRVDLQQTKMLTRIIEEYAYPQKINGKYVAEPGLYIEGLTDLKEGQDSAVYYLRLDDDSLGFDSYKLLQKFYEARKLKSSSQIQITGVQWTPYTRLVDGDEFSETIYTEGRYYLDDGHYGYVKLNDIEGYNVATQFSKDLANGLVYVLDANFDEDEYMIKSRELLETLIDSKAFTNLDGTKAPNITGDIYICNSEDDAVNETLIRSKFNVEYPELNISFKHVNKCYSMKFIIPDFNEKTMEYLGTYKYAPLTDGSVEKSIQKSTQIDFGNPYTLYNPEASKENYDFIAWSTSPDVNDTTKYIGHKSNQEEHPEINLKAWDDYIASIQPVEGEEAPLDYTIYALFVKTKYKVQFFNGTSQIGETDVTYGECLAPYMPALMPVHPDESKLDIFKAYKFLGFSRNDTTMVVKNESEAQLVDYNMMFSVTNYKFYAVYMEVDVHASATDSKYFTFTEDIYEDPVDSSYNISGWQIQLAPGQVLSGKVTLPTEHEGKPIISAIGFSQQAITHVFWSNSSGDNPNFRRFYQGAFQNSQLVFFEFPSKLRIIGPSAFLSGFNGSKMTDNRNAQLLGECPLVRIDSDAFNNRFAFSNLDTFKLRGTVEEIGTLAFMFASPANNGIKNLQIGSSDEPSKLKVCGTVASPGIKTVDPRHTSYFVKCTIYAKNGEFNGDIVSKNEPLICNYGTLDMKWI